MRFVRGAALDDVLSVTPSDPATRDTIRRIADWGYWEFDRADVGSIGTDRNPANNGYLRLSETHGSRVTRMHSDAPGAARDLLTHAYFVGELVAGRLLPPPVVASNNADWDKQMLDGAHRLYAVYEHMARVPAFRLHVFWNSRG
jgi:hypothetical protein